MAYITIDAITEDNERVEALVDSSDPPRIGDFFDYEGVRLRRLPTVPHARVKKSISEVVAYSLPRKKTVDKYGLAAAPRYNDRGFAVFDSRKEIAEFAAKHNDDPVNGGQIAWDPDGNE